MSAIRSAAGRALALDMDGVLIDGMPLHMEAWTEALRIFKLSFEKSRLYMLEGIPTLPTARILAAESGKILSDREIERLAITKREIYNEIFEVVPLPGARSFLEVGRGYKYRMAIVTGSTKSAAERVIETLNIGRDILFTVVGDDTVRGKPDPAPYELARKKLGVPHQNCLAVDNAPAGVQSATSARLPCLGIATYVEPSEIYQATAVLPSMLIAAEWIKSEATVSSGRGPWRMGK